MGEYHKKSPIPIQTNEFQMFKSFQGQKVLVTGHTGFCGSWLSLWLKKLGADVYGIAKPPSTNPNLYEHLDIWTKENSFFCDISEPNTVIPIIKSIKPDIVFHLAAQPLVRQSYIDPAETYRSNVIGTVEILEAIRQTESVKAAVLVTTDKVYENKEWIYPYRESDRLGGKDPYSASKAACEIAISSYRQAVLDSDRVLCASARGGNVIGGGDWSTDRLIPDIVRSITTQTPLVLRNPNATRPWQHVLALCHGYLILAEKLMLGESEYADGWNFGPADNIAVTTQELTQQFGELWLLPKVEIVPSELAEAQLLAIDSTKAQVQLGWKPAWNTSECIQHTVNWYKTFYDKGDVLQLTHDQIESYGKAISHEFYKL